MDGTPLRRAIAATGLRVDFDLVVSIADAPLGIVVGILHGALASVGLEAILARRGIPAHDAKIPQSRHPAASDTSPRTLNSRPASL